MKSMDVARARRSTAQAKTRTQTYNQSSQKVLGQRLQYVAFSPIVRSKSKQMFSFGKSDRFPAEQNPT